MQTFNFKIRGMDCAEEVDALKRVISPLVGGENNLSFDILRGKMSVNGFSGTATEIIRAVNKTGMQAEPWREGPRPEHAGGGRLWLNHGRTIVTIVSGLMTLAGFLLHATLRGNVGEAFGSEGLGQAHADLPAFFPCRLTRRTTL